MQASPVKFVTAAVIAILAVTGISVIGFTADSVDAKQGVMIDFGYYEVDWIEIEFPEGMTGDQALDTACSGKSYMVVRNGDGSVYSVNNKTELLNVEWGMYVLNGDGNWVQVSNPNEYDVSNEKIISWARTGVGSAMMPSVDQTGFTYYSYVKLGKNPMGEDLKIVTLAPFLHAVGADLRRQLRGMLVDAPVRREYELPVAEDDGGASVAARFESGIPLLHTFLDHLCFSFQQQRYLVHPYGGIGAWVPLVTYRQRSCRQGSDRP